LCWTKNLKGYLITVKHCFYVVKFHVLTERICMYVNFHGPIFSFMCMSCRSLFALFPLVIVFLSFFDLQILITPLISSSYSSYPFSFLNKKSQSIICSKIKLYTHFKSNTAFKYPGGRGNWHTCKWKTHVRRFAAE
jgi:hypothetical protein